MNADSYYRENIRVTAYVILVAVNRIVAKVVASLVIDALLPYFLTVTIY